MQFGGRKTFIETFGRTFGTKRVTVTPGSTHPGREPQTFEGLVQHDTVGFNVDTPVYEGDKLEWDDPRGGKRQVFARKVDVADAGGMMGSEMAHINVHFSDTKPPGHRAAGATRGHHIVVNGNNINIALGAGNISQQVSISAGFETLGDSIGEALGLIESSADIDEDDAALAREATAALLEELSNDVPKLKAIKPWLASLRGVLSSMLNGASGGAASALIEKLIL